MTKYGALIAGLFITPAVPAAIAAMATRITPDDDIFSNWALFPIYYIFTMPFMAVFGVPLMFLGINHNLVRWWSAATAGAFVGAIVGLTFRQHDMNLIPSAAVGAVTGLTFWLIWRIGRDEPATEKPEPPTPKIPGELS